MDGPVLRKWFHPVLPVRIFVSKPRNDILIMFYHSVSMTFLVGPGHADIIHGFQRSPDYGLFAGEELSSSQGLLSIGF